MQPAVMARRMLSNWLRAMDIVGAPLATLFRKGMDRVVSADKRHIGSLGYVNSWRPRTCGTIDRAVGAALCGRPFADGGAGGHAGPPLPGLLNPRVPRVPRGSFP